MSARDNFSKGVRDVLAHRAGFRCSKPDCRAATAGPANDSAKKGSIGVAAHITAASPGGPRYDEALSPEERSSANNGIWLCDNHAREIDGDEDAYPTNLLVEWKKHAEEEAAAMIGRPLLSSALTISVEVSLQRDSNDGLLVVGETNLPDGTKLMGSLRHRALEYFAQAKCRTHERRLVLGPFTDSGSPLPQRWYEVEICSYFNNPWGQPDHVMKMIGKEGERIAGPHTHMVDPELDDSELAIRAEFECPAPMLNSESPLSEAETSESVEIIRRSTLEVKGHSNALSAEPVGEVIKTFLSVTGIEELRGWSAKQIAPGLVEVEYSYLNGQEPTVAKWQVIPKTEEVKYRNRSAKIFSWMPSD